MRLPIGSTVTSSYPSFFISAAMRSTTAPSWPLSDGIATMSRMNWTSAFSFFRESS